MHAKPFVWFNSSTWLVTASTIANSRSGGGTYSQQLGTEYAHDPDTGENFLMNYGADYRDSGPQGAGFYRDVNGELRKLEPGRSE